MGCSVFWISRKLLRKMRRGKVDRGKKSREKYAKMYSLSLSFYRGIAERGVFVAIGEF